MPQVSGVPVRAHSGWSRLRARVRGRKHAPLSTCPELATRLLFDAVEVLRALSVPHALDYGTLLGVARDGRFIPWDRDLDLSLHGIGPADAVAFANAIARRGWSVRPTRTMPQDGPAWRRGDLARLRVASPGSPLRTSSIVAMDLCVKYLRGGDAWWALVGRDRFAVCRADARHYDGFDALSFAGRALAVPRDAPGYLARIYGDWRTPRRDHDPWRDDGAVVRLCRAEGLNGGAARDRPSEGRFS